MGSDDLHHKRRASRATARFRERVKRDELKRALITCEGETEANYFKHLTNKQSAIIFTISSDCGTSPQCVISHAEELDENDGNEFDKIFAVFDCDTTEPEKLSKLLNKATDERINYIYSSPCFEYWLYLHFKFTRSPVLGNKHEKSSGQQMEKMLKNSDTRMKAYIKGASYNFEQIYDYLDTAILNAENTVKDANKVEQINPSTNVHILVKYIFSIT